jgi:hypothetical protein
VTQTFTTADYLLEDHPRTLFPFTTTRILVEQFSQELQRYLYDKVIASTSPESGFMAVDDRAETRRSDRGWRDRFVSECAAA